MDTKGAVEIENLREFIITNPSQASKLYWKGSRARSTSWTNANESSSRSHCLIRISISCSGPPDRNRDTSKLWMVDLGGSERLLKTQSTGQTLEEGKAINMSLSALGDVISALQKKQAHIPYRNSKLTQILRDSVGEGSRMLMLVHISPKEDDLPETICSLGFATRVRGIHLGWELSPEVKVQKEATMAELMQQIKCLEDDCQSARNNIGTVEFLLREKKKHLANSNPSSGAHETPKNPVSQDTEVHTIELGNVAQGSVGLPRYMNSTACSRIRGKSSDADIKYTTGFKNKREHLSGRRKSLLGSAKNVIFPEMDQSLCNSESTVSCKSVHRQPSLPIKRNLSRMYSKQLDFEESQCFSESRMPEDNGMLNNEKMNGIYSEWSSFDGSQFLSGCNTPKNIGEYNNMKVNGMYYKSCTLDESKCMLECNMPKDILEYNHFKMNRIYSIKKNLSRVYSKQCDSEELQCFSECSTPKDSGLLDSERMNGIYSEYSTFDGSQFRLGCNTPKNIEENKNTKLSGMHSKSCTLEESKCMSECNMPDNIAKANNLKMNETYSKLCTSDESNCLLECEMADSMKVSETFSKKFIIDESECFSECSMPESGLMSETFSKKFIIDESECFPECSMPESGLMSETYSNKFIIDESECFSECTMPESELMSSLMPRCKRVIAFQSPQNVTINKDYLSNNMEKSDLALIGNTICYQPINNKGGYDQTTLWENPSKDKNEYNQDPHRKQNSKKFLPKASLKPCISMGEPMTSEKKIPKDMAAATTKMAETSLKKVETPTMANPTTGLYFTVVKIAYAVLLGVGLLKTGLEDEFFYGLLA